MSKTRAITLLIKQAPYGSSKAKAALDMALSAAVFEQNVQLIFMSDGVFQLLPDQQPAGILAKNTSAALTALPLYGIESVYVDAESLQQRNLSLDGLAIDVESVSTEQLATLIHESDVLVTL